MVVVVGVDVIVDVIVDVDVDVDVDLDGLRSRIARRADYAFAAATGAAARWRSIRRASSGMASITFFLAPPRIFS